MELIADRQFKLVYLWVEEYKNIIDKSLRFSLNYDVKRNDKEISIEHTDFFQYSTQLKNPVRHLDFFTALIGKNGTGKSNLIELISYIYTTGFFPKEMGQVGANSFCILEQMTNQGSQFYLLSPSYMSYSLKNNGIQDLAFIPRELAKSFGQTVLYHPLSDVAAGTSSSTGLTSLKISSNPFKKLITGVSDSELAKRFSDSAKDLTDISKLAYISENKFSRLLFLYSDFKENITENVDLHFEFEGFSKNTSYVKLYNEFILYISRKNDLTKDDFILIYLFLISVSAVQSDIKKSIVPHLDGLMICLKILLTRFKVFQSFEKDINKYIERQGWDKLVDELSLHLKGFELSIDSFEAGFNDVHGPHLFIELANVDDGNGIDFICGTDWVDLPNLKRAFQAPGLPIKIDGLSSGEITAVHFFNEIKLALIQEPNSVVILDEPENSFHPEWQRCLVYLLSSLFLELKVEPQVIISSHSPFVLSDILDGKALALGNNRSLNDSFAANIHEMLADSFFLESTIGEAAKIEIERLVGFINDHKSESFLPDASFEDKLLGAELLVSHIGDRLLRKELKKRLVSFSQKNNVDSAMITKLVRYSQSNPDLKNKLEDLQALFIVDEK
ncbi:AAA family ATPase [Pseudoalteromonas sp. SR41-1]|uniref:AAA family ATPase n=1 Tax=Pseudoalteromonas sp. SR41-1 TaxID=2760952 RepID=UPI0016025B40|nr:AAA family ATPase [Pseudoalteromonas sp. SR41-1]MBB1282663.1 AAA family ATPase [Pseudoalteromonas sp. SR41-1]